MILAPLVFIASIERRKIRGAELGFLKSDPMAGALLAGKILLALIIFSFLLSFIFTLLQVNDLGKVEGAIAGVLSTSPLWMAYFLIVRVFTEEFFFRSFLVPRIGVVGSSVAFAISHVGYGSIAEILGAFVLGGILAIAYRDSGKITPNYIAHMLYNVFAIGIFSAF